MQCSVITKRYQGLGYSDQALALMQQYRDTCHRFSGDFTLLWHNSQLGSEADVSGFMRHWLANVPQTISAERSERTNELLDQKDIC